MGGVRVCLRFGIAVDGRLREATTPPSLVLNWTLAGPGGHCAENEHAVRSGAISPNPLRLAASPVLANVFAANTHVVVFFFAVMFASHRTNPLGRLAGLAGADVSVAIELSPLSASVAAVTATGRSTVTVLVATGLLPHPATPTASSVLETRTQNHDQSRGSSRVTAPYKPWRG